jgi:hydroxypyruvate reductase
MKPQILQHGRLMTALEKALAERYALTPLWKEDDAASFLAREGHRFSSLVTSARAGADKDLLDALPSLKVIVSFGVGYETLDIDAARARGIAVSNTPDVLNDCVADLALGLILDTVRGLSRADRFVRNGKWAQGGSPTLQRQVTGKRLGIVGLGRIGTEIARRAEGFRMQVRYHARRSVPDVPWIHEPTLTGLAQWADILVLACTGGPATHHLVSSEVLTALGPRGYLINVSRGSVVDEAALVNALQQGVIAGAGLDVYEVEPHIPEALIEMENVVLLPHIGSATEETRAAMSALVLHNLDSFFSHGRLVTPVP